MEQLDCLKKILTEVREKGKNFVSLTELRGRKKVQMLFGLTKNDNLKNVEKSLQTCLGSEFMILKKGQSRFLAFKTSLHEKKAIDEFVLDAFRLKYSQDGPFSPNSVSLPITKTNFTASLDRLFKTREISIIVNGVETNVSQSQPTAPVSAASATESPPGDRDLFFKAFKELDKGRNFTRICHMRRKLGWSEERFDKLLRKLRSEGSIQLRPGDVSSMTEEDIALSFTDEDNFFYATLTILQQ